MPDEGSAGMPPVITLREGDVVSYTPHNNWCREGVALVNDDGRAVDTYWSADRGDVLSADELATAKLLFNVHDYEELHGLDARETWLTYHPDDRGRIPRQHGHWERLFVLKGSQPDLATQIANAEERVRDAELEVRSAQRRLERARERLAGLKGADDMLRDRCWRASSDHPGRNQGERERDQSGGAKDAIGRLAGRYA